MRSSSGTCFLPRALKLTHRLLSKKRLPACLPVCLRASLLREFLYAHSNSEWVELHRYVLCFVYIYRAFLVALLEGTSRSVQLSTWCQIIW